MLSFALLIYLHLFTKQNRGIEQLSIALNFVELGNKLEKHVLHSSRRRQGTAGNRSAFAGYLHSDIQHVSSKPIRCVQKKSRDFTERIFSPRFALTTTGYNVFFQIWSVFCSIYNYCYFFCGFIQFVSRHTFEELISWCLLVTAHLFLFLGRLFSSIRRFQLDCKKAKTNISQ